MRTELRAEPTEVLSIGKRANATIPAGMYRTKHRTSNGWLGCDHESPRARRWSRLSGRSRHLVGSQHILQCASDLDPNAEIIAYLRGHEDDDVARPRELNALGRRIHLFKRDTDIDSQKRVKLALP